MQTVISLPGNIPAMKIAITRLAGKEGSDPERCRRFGHDCYSVYPLRSAIREDIVDAFVDAVDRNTFDCIFFTSALPATIIAPRLNRFPRVIAIGPRTAAVLQQYDIECETLKSFYSKDFVPYLGEWISGKRIGIPRADVPNPALMEAIKDAGGIAEEFRCYELTPTEEPLCLTAADALLFTSAMSFEKAVFAPRPELLIMAIGEVTAEKMRRAGVEPGVVGDGSLEGTLIALNTYLRRRTSSG
ncbi:MAG: uroporphyrinogen-III synthase [Methanoregula sp. PtaU1.Bin051]|nr:MAG: uroporphyrinogen-III synthase [Methanoregula sp. PtaU1.Bin051]